MNEISDANHERDFNANLWRWAEQFIQFDGENKLIYNAKILRSFYVISQHLFSIGLLAKHNIDRLSTLNSLKSTQVLSLICCIVKASQPNDLGDMTITIKVGNNTCI